MALNGNFKMAIDGDWNIAVDTTMGQQTATLSLKTEGGALTGTMSAMAGSQPIENGAVDGDNGSGRPTSSCQCR